MTAINFPSSPSDGDTHVVGGVTYTYNNAETKWKTTINSNAFLPLSGGTVSGNILMGGEIQHDGDTDTNIAFDTDTILFDTAGSERFRVGSAGQLGIGGATYGTDGQVLTSGGASAAPAWEDLPAGISQTFSAVSLSGSAQVFSGIPSTAYRVVVTLGGMSFSDTANMEFVLGYGSGPTYQTTTYYYTRGTTASTGERNNQPQFDNASFTATGNEYSGQFVFQKTSGNRWHVEGFFMEEGASQCGLINGFVILAEPLTAIKIEGSAGSFDAGNASIWYLSE